jgi:hypothetical protein
VKACQAQRAVPGLLLAVLFFFASGQAHAQFATPTGKYAGTAGSSCAGLGQQYAWPDANGQILQCMSDVWTLVSPSSVSSGVYLGTSTALTNPTRSASELNTGLYSPASGTVGVVSLGTEQMRIVGGGVTIGTSSLAGKMLNVNGAISGATVNAVGQLTANYANIAGTVAGAQFFSGFSSVTQPGFTNGSGAGGIFFPANNVVAFTTNNLEAMRITASHQIGIGTSAPDALLSLGTSSPVIDVVRMSAADTAGSNLTVQAVGAVSGGTDLAGGNTIISSGISTGTQTSNVQFQIYPASVTSGTADNTALTALTLTAIGTSGGAAHRRSAAGPCDDPGCGRSAPAGSSGPRSRTN